MRKLRVTCPSSETDSIDIKAVAQVGALLPFIRRNTTHVLPMSSFRHRWNMAEPRRVRRISVILIDRTRNNSHVILLNVPTEECSFNRLVNPGREVMFLTAVLVFYQSITTTNVVSERTRPIPVGEHKPALEHEPTELPHQLL